MNTFQSKGALVTGGAGFIGSHIVDALLMRGIPVVVFDNFKTGRMENLPKDNPLLKVYQGDCVDVRALKEAMKGCDTVFHLQANADIRGGEKNSNIDFEQNTFCTFNVLRAMKDMRKQRLIFASSAAVYGDARGTRETDTLIQTSHYGASKLAGEAMIQAHAAYDRDFEYSIFRFVSWIGPRCSHGVIADFVNKLQSDPRHLHILGNGKQTKSCLDVSDGIRAIFTALERDPHKRALFNVGHNETITVIEIAVIVMSQMELKGVAIECEDTDRGWVGDNPFVLLNTDILKSLGWNAAMSIEPAIRRTVDYLLRRSPRAEELKVPDLD